jgi:hypothetical protein
MHTRNLLQLSENRKYDNMDASAMRLESMEHQRNSVEREKEGINNRHHNCNDTGSAY